MDEPDAHIHPTLAKQFLDTIQYELVAKWKIQVIMTTHNPATISFVKKKNLFLLSKHADNIIEVTRAQNRQQAIQILTSNLVYINIPMRFVLVESTQAATNKDELFFQLFQQKLVEMKIMTANPQLVFKSVGSCHEIERVVKSLAYDGKDRSLKSLLFGLLDGDDKGKNDIPGKIYRLKRYSIENYVYDPINSFFFFMNRNIYSTNLITICDRIEKSLTGISPPAFSMLLQNFRSKVTIDEKVITDAMRTILRLPIAVAHKILQTIINEVTYIIKQKIESAIEQTKKYLDSIHEILEEKIPLYCFRNVVITPANTSEIEIFPLIFSDLFDLVSRILIEDFKQLNQLDLFNIKNNLASRKNDYTSEIQKNLKQIPVANIIDFCEDIAHKIMLLFKTSILKNLEDFIFILKGRTTSLYDEQQNKIYFFEDGDSYTSKDIQYFYSDENKNEPLQVQMEFSYSEFILKIRGHDLENIYSEMFKNTESEHISKANKKIVWQFFRQTKYLPGVPQEIEEKFKQIQNPDNACTNKKSDEYVSKSDLIKQMRELEKKNKQLQAEIDTLKSRQDKKREEESHANTKDDQNLTGAADLFGSLST